MPNGRAQEAPISTRSELEVPALLFEILELTEAWSLKFIL